MMSFLSFIAITMSSMHALCILKKKQLLIKLDLILKAKVHH